MRWLEWAWIAAWIAAWIIDARRRPTGGVRLGLAAAPLVMLAAHALLEGMRWQLTPAYVGVALFTTRLLKRRLGLNIAVSGVLAALGVVLGVLFPVPDLPRPTGPYAVGTFSFDVVDSARPEIFTDEPGDVRRLPVQVWYPANVQPGARPEPWLSRADVMGPAIAAWIRLPAFVFSHAGLIRGNAVADAPWSDAQRRWPLLIYSHGWGGFRQINANQSEELASHGYVVVAIDHPYGALAATFGDGTVILNKRSLLPQRDTPEFLPAAQKLEDVYARDVTFVLDELERRDAANSPLAGRIAFDRVGFFGHSTGGGGVVIACARDRRCKALAGQDVWIVPVPDDVVAAGLDRPALYLRSEQWTGNDNDARLSRFLENSQGATRSLSIPGSKHYDFTLTPLFSPLASYLGLKGPISADEVMSLINAEMREFFDGVLKR